VEITTVLSILGQELTIEDSRFGSDISHTPLSDYSLYGRDTITSTYQLII
jgi:hypothetical protein